MNDLNVFNERRPIARRSLVATATATLVGASLPATALAQGAQRSTTDRGQRASIQFQNAGSATLPAGIAVFAQSFAQGEVPATASLAARVGGGASEPQPVQMDVKTRYGDRSVKMAVLSMSRPSIAARQSLDVVLVAAGSPQPDTAPLDLAAALNGRSFAITLAFRDGQTVEFDVLSALRVALGRPDAASFWMQGPLATQARVMLPVARRAFRLVCDVTAFRDGSYAVDAQFANDRAMEAAGGRAAYTTVVRMDGRQVASETIDQMQYQVWHRRFVSNGGNSGWQGHGLPSAGWLNIKPDLGKLIETKAIASYDRTLQIAPAVFDYMTTAMRDPAWNAPLAANGVRRHMPEPGGRWDIGITTVPNTAWLLTGHPRAAAYALGQAEAAGAVPWNMWDSAQGTWLNAGRYPRLWVDSRGGTGRPGDTASTGLTQQWEWHGDQGWTPETAHQPDLAYVPYLLTGERWLLDRLLAQAAWNTVANWPGDAGGGERFNRDVRRWNLVVAEVQPRSAAWAIRQIDNTAWVVPDGFPEQAYFRSVSDVNWRWLANRRAEWTSLQGDAHGYLPNQLWGRQGRASPWEQDYFVMVAAIAASRGQPDASAVLQWLGNFLVGRFSQANDVFSPKDGVANAIQVASATAVPHRSWAAIGAATRAAGLSNTDTVRSPSGWNRSEGVYGQIGLAALASFWRVTNDGRARAAYERLARLGPPFSAKSDFERDPNFAVTIAGMYGRA